MSLLFGAVRDLRKTASAEAREHDLLPVTPQGLQNRAQTDIDMSMALHIQIKSETTASTTP